MKVKRTYNLSPAAIATVKRLVEVEGVASSQDALVEHAIAELDRIIRDAHDARLWSEAAGDRAYQAELEQIDTQLPGDDVGRWEERLRPPVALARGAPNYARHRVRYTGSG